MQTREGALYWLDVEQLSSVLEVSTVKAQETSGCDTELLRGYAKLKKFQKSKIKLDGSRNTPPPTPLSKLFRKPITDKDSALKS